MDNKILPLGSVVNLKDGDGTELLIVSRASIVKEHFREVYYDYGAILIPQGFLSPEAVYFFNKEVLFKGHLNKDEEAFEEHYDMWIESSDVSKGTI